MDKKEILKSFKFRTLGWNRCEWAREFICTYVDVTFRVVLDVSHVYWLSILVALKGEKEGERRRERGKDHFGLYVLRRTNVVFRYRDATMSETLAIIPYNRVSKKKKK